MICTNPDLIVDRGEEREFCAGTIAKLFEDIGGEVNYFGKPYPNPFNPSTRIEFSVVHEQNINLEVFGINGKLIETLIETRSFAGKHAINWNPKNIAAGIYFIRMTVEDQFKTEKVILLK